MFVLLWAGPAHRSLFIGNECLKLVPFASSIVYLDARTTITSARVCLTRNILAHQPEATRLEHAD